MVLKTFEDCLAFIEHELGIKLLSYQKTLLYEIYEGKQIYYMPARGSNKRILSQSIELLTHMVPTNITTKENIYG